MRWCPASLLCVSFINRAKRRFYVRVGCAGVVGADSYLIWGFNTLRSVLGMLGTGAGTVETFLVDKVRASNAIMSRWRMVKCLDCD